MMRILKRHNIILNKLLTTAIRVNSGRKKENNVLTNKYKSLTLEILLIKKVIVSEYHIRP